MTKTATEAPFTLKRVQEMLGLSKTTVAGLIEAGFVAPVRGVRNELRFSFQDLMLLRTAFTLQRARIPPRKILRALAKLKADLPDELPLTGLRITAVGAEVAVRDNSGQWQADSGQLLMDFEVSASPGGVSIIHAPIGSRTPVTVDWFRRGESLEASDPPAAEAAYRQAIASTPSLAGPYLNLGAMLCERGRCAEAVELYEAASRHVTDEPYIHFNHAIALEDQNRLNDAVRAYERALVLDDSFGDAHYNLGLLRAKLGDGRGSLRHLSAYHRLTKNEQP